METMQQPTVKHSSFTLERSVPTSPDRVFSAFSDPAKKIRWHADGRNSEVIAFEMDFRVGGTELHRYRFKDGTPFPGVELKNDWIYQEIVQNRLVVSANAMDLGGKRISASLVTIELLPTETGTDLICTHQGAFFENSGGPEMREAGWRSLFDKLAAELAK